jgi:hypothetical protein
MAKILMQFPRGKLTATLKDTETARKLVAALPCDSVASTWGDEVYFQMPVKARLEADACDVVEPGTVCFWVQGSSLALPFGPTPVSRGDECRLVTAVNLLGKIEGDLKVLKGVRDGDAVNVSIAPA